MSKINEDLTCTAKIEQTYAFQKRMKYVAETDSFIEQKDNSLSWERNVRQPYGWITETGTPPNEHCDVIIMTENEYELGDKVPVRIIGVFVRSDKDYKYVAVCVERNITDLSQLEPSEIEDLNRLYKAFTPEEGWFGKTVAEKLIREYENTPKRKIIITVQHSESEHHVNGHTGGQGNWNLTERGKEQAFKIGEWLGNYEGCKYSFKIYSSDLNRAAQTADGIQKALNMPDSSVIKTPLLREFNLGEGNGKERSWYNKNISPKPEKYDPSHRSFPSAENDLEFWTRINQFYKELISGDEQRIIVVSHGGALNMFHRMLLNLDFEQAMKIDFFGHSSGVCRFVIEPDGTTVVSYMNYWVC